MKNLFKPFLMAATVASLFFVNSCTKVCDPGFEGSDCKTEIRSKYVGTYTASGTDNQGGTYTNWTVILSNSSTNVLGIIINLQNASISLNATIADEGGSYTIASQNVGGFTYTGTGTLTSNAMTLQLNEVGGTPSVTTIFNFTGTKQ